MAVITKGNRRLKRRRRVRAKISGTQARPRISVFRSNRGLSAQLIDDIDGKTLAAVNWFEPELGKLSKEERAKRAGEALAARDPGETSGDSHRYVTLARFFAENVAVQAASLERTAMDSAEAVTGADVVLLG